MKAKPIMKYTDCSTENYFQFIFHCDRCGAGVKSEKFLLCTSDFERTPQGRAYTLLWNKQHDEAYERALSEARFEFNVCSGCGRRVCNSCFRSTDNGRDFCDDCRGRHKPPLLLRLLRKITGRRSKGC